MPQEPVSDEVIGDELQGRMRPGSGYFLVKVQLENDLPRGSRGELIQDLVDLSHGVESRHQVLMSNRAEGSRQVIVKR